MFKNFRTTGILSLVIWAAFLIVGLLESRPFICIISGLFFVTGFYRRAKIIKQKDPAEILWDRFVETNPEMTDYNYQFWNFVSNEDDTLFDKLRNGKVCAQSFSVDFFDANNKPLPSIGQINMICCNGEVVGIGRTKDIIYSKFNEVDSNLAKMEGFQNISKWNSAKKKIFSIQSECMGVNFSEEMDLIFEIFELIYTVDEKK